VTCNYFSVEIKLDNYVGNIFKYHLKFKKYIINLDSFAVKVQSIRCNQDYTYLYRSTTSNVIFIFYLTMHLYQSQNIAMDIINFKTVGDIIRYCFTSETVEVSLMSHEFE